MFISDKIIGALFDGTRCWLIKSGNYNAQFKSWDKSKDQNTQNYEVGCFADGYVVGIWGQFESGPSSNDANILDYLIKKDPEFVELFDYSLVCFLYIFYA